MGNIALSYDDDLGGLRSSQEYAYGGFTHKWTIDYSTLNTTAGSAADVVKVPLCSTGADWACFRGAFNVTAAFSEDPAMTIEVGTAGNPDSIIDGQIISSTGAFVIVGAGSAAGGTPAVLADSFGASNTELIAQFTTSAVAPGSFTSGSVDIFLELVDFNKM